MDRHQARRLRIVVGLVAFITGLEMVHPPDGRSAPRRTPGLQQACGVNGCAVPRLKEHSVNDTSTTGPLVPLTRPLTTAPGLPAIPRPLASAIFAVG